mmetsp:Transcript_43263/g.41638  ORF Transcript_43263/g.41638 Transcript_43263/m.41638 type:complete len:424 (-) Transcript_43263:43-1314(-)
MSPDELILGDPHELTGFLLIVHFIVNLLSRLHRVLFGDMHEVVAPPLPFIFFLFLLALIGYLLGDSLEDPFDLEGLGGEVDDGVGGHLELHLVLLGLLLQRVHPHQVALEVHQRVRHSLLRSSHIHVLLLLLLFLEGKVGPDEGLDHGLSDVHVEYLLEADRNLHVLLSMFLDLEVDLAFLKEGFPLSCLGVVVVEHAFEGGLSDGLLAFLLAFILEVLEGHREHRIEHEVVVINDHNVEAHALEAEDPAGVAAVVHFLVVELLLHLIEFLPQRHALLFLPAALLDGAQGDEVEGVGGGGVDVDLVLIKVEFFGLLVQIDAVLEADLLFLLVGDEELHELLVARQEPLGHLLDHLEVRVRNLHQSLVRADLALLIVHQLTHLPLVPQVTRVEVEQVERRYYLPLPYLLEILVLEVVHIAQERT